MSQPPRGTQDFLPEEMIVRNYVFDTVRKVYESWGYDPLETPAFEEWELLSAKMGGGEEIKKEIYYFKDKSNRELGLRFDLTVPMARVVASNPQLPKPFKRFQIGRVWRYDKPGSGRRREFWQSDIDILGSNKAESDAEAVSVASECLDKLGFKDYTVRISNRKILEAFVKELKIKDPVQVFRSIDKLDKIGKKGVEEELVKRGVDKSSIKKVLDFINTDYKKVKLKDQEGLEELKAVLAKLKEMGNKKVKVDLSLVRGLEYYTGSVFEISLKGAEWSISGGGRYDTLIETLGGKPTPAVGISLGIERIIEIIKKENMIDIGKTSSKIYLANVKDKTEIFKLSKELRKEGIPNEFDLMGKDLRKQLDYVNSKGIPFVIVLGPKEIESGKAKLRDMDSGEEKEIKLDAKSIKKLVK